MPRLVHGRSKADVPLVAVRATKITIGRANVGFSEPVRIGNEEVSGIYRHIMTASEQGVLVITVELTEVKDYMVAEELRFELVHAVKQAMVSNFVLDLRRMTFMTSLACVSFLGLKHGVKEVNGRLVLCNMTEFIRKVFNAKRLLTPSHATGSVAFEEALNLADAIQRFQNETKGPD